MVGKIQWLFLGLLIEFSTVYRIVKLGSLKKGCYEEIYLITPLDIYVPSILDESKCFSKSDRPIHMTAIN